MRMCTLVGADDTTSADALWLLSARYSFVEWAIHYNVDEEGCGRYPSFAWISDLIDRIEHAGTGWRPKFALHISGEALDDFIRGVGDVVDAAGHFDRIQLNLHATQMRLSEFAMIFDRWRHKTIITRHNKQNSHLSILFASLRSHAFIFDTSLGCGIERLDWPTPLYGKICGYTGGLGPDNIVDQLPRIYSAAENRPFWIAAEQKMRGADNRFHLEKVERMLDGVESVALRYGSIAPFRSAALPS